MRCAGVLDDDDNSSSDLEEVVAAPEASEASESPEAEEAAEVTPSEDVDFEEASAADGAVASTGGPAEFEVFLATHTAPETPQEERRYQSALAGCPDEAEMQRTLDMTLSGAVRTQDAPYLLAVCLRNREQGYLAWQFIKDNWDRINEAFPANSIVRMLSGITSLSKSEHADDVLAFFEDHDVPQGQLTLQQMLEKLRVNVAYRERESERFAASLMD